MSPWPELPIAAWRDTYATLLLYTQIVGKIRLALTPKMNQWWNVPLYVTTCGLTTSPMPYRDRTLSIDLDFIEHRLTIRDSDGHVRAFQELRLESASERSIGFAELVGRPSILLGRCVKIDELQFQSTS